MLMVEAAAERVGLMHGRLGDPSASHARHTTAMSATGIDGDQTNDIFARAESLTKRRRRRDSPPSPLTLTMIPTKSETMATPPNSAPSSPMQMDLPWEAPTPPCEEDPSQFKSQALQLLASHLEIHELVRVASVCRSWRDAVVSSPMMWRRIIIPMSLSSNLTDNHLAVLLARGGNSPVELDLRGCTRITNAGINAIKGCKNLRRLDVRGTKAQPTAAFLHSLSPVTAALARGALQLPLRRLSVLHLGACVERWHGVVQSPAEWRQLLCRLSGDKIATAAVSATASLVDFDSEVVIFASQLGSFAGSMWPKPQSRIVAAVGTDDSTVVAQVKVPAVVENAGWFDAVVVPRRGGTSPTTVEWFFDAAAATGERALDFEHAVSLTVDGEEDHPVAAICQCREPAAQLDAFLEWACSAGHGRSARHLTTSLAQGRLQLETIAEALPADVRTRLARELLFRTGCSPLPRQTSRRRPAVTTPAETPPRSPDFPEVEDVVVMDVAVVVAASPVEAVQEEARSSTTVVPPPRPGRPGAITTRQTSQPSPLSRTMADATTLRDDPSVASMQRYFADDDVVHAVSVEELLVYPGTFLAETLKVTVPRVERRRSETPTLSLASTSSAIHDKPEIDSPQRSKRKRWTLQVESRASELDFPTKFRTTDLSSVVVIGGLPACCHDDSW